MKRLILIALAILCVSMSSGAVFAQTTIFNETVGTPAATTPVNSYTGWSSTGLTFTGTGDVRTSTPSTGYTGASGSGNVFLTNSGTANFQISAINTTGYTALTLSFGVFKSTTASNGSELSVQVSTDGVNYTNLTVPALPTGSGTAVWALRTASGTIPSTSNLRIRFTNTSATPQFRLDDIILTGTLPTPNISINDVSQTEGDSGITNYSFTVSLSSPAPAGGVTFDIATADDTATVADNDYAFQTLTGQTITQGNTTYNFSVSVNGDTSVETDERFFVNVSNVTGANGTDLQGEGTIVNDDTEPATVEFSSSTYFEDESQTAFITVERFGDLSGTTTVDYSTQDNNLLGTPATGGTSCTSSVDYIHASGTLTFAPEENSKQFQIQLCSDVLSETDEYFNVYLSNPTNGTLGKITNAQVYINDTANQFVNTEPIFIGTGGDSYDSSIAVTNAPTSIGSMRVTLFDFNHFTADDVDVLLVGPQGQKFLLMADAGGEDGLAEDATITFDDNAGVVLPDDAQIFSGKYEPTTWEPGQTSFPAPAPAGPYSEPGNGVGGTVTLASVFVGTNANGTWTLYIRDDNGGFQPAGADGVVGGGWGIQFLAPTAANVSVSGQVRSGKMPISGATVTITGGDLTEPLVTRTNSFGNYIFEGLTMGRIYVVTVAAKRYTFQQSSIVLNVEDNIAGADFEAEDK